LPAPLQLQPDNNGGYVLIFLCSCSSLSSFYRK
jgi:hypothetical protein